MEVVELEPFDGVSVDPDVDGEDGRAGFFAFLNCILLMRELVAAYCCEFFPYWAKIAARMFGSMVLREFLPLNASSRALTAAW